MFRPEALRSTFGDVDPLTAIEEDMRPRTRAECATGERPCPWVSCKYHLYLEVSDAGGIKIYFPHKEIDEIPETCALDVADRGGSTLEEVGRLINLTRERIRQIEVRGLVQLSSGVDNLDRDGDE